MNFLEAQRLVRGFAGGAPLPFLFATSGTAEPFVLYLRAAAARHGRAAEPELLPFGTLGQALLRPPAGPEAILLLPWDLAPEADWRSGIPTESPDESAMRTRALDVAARLAARPDAALFYLPASIPPLWSDPARNAGFASWLHSVAAGLGATPVPPEAFALSTYLATGCPIGGAMLGRVAELVVAHLVTPRAEPAKVLVTDLDNVLWSGVIAEDGADAIAFRPDGRGYRHYVYQTLLARLRREGVLLAAVSRNDAEVVLPPLRGGAMPLQEADFVAVLASYNAKSAQIRALATQLNLGLESFVFVDDNPVEITEVQLELPLVRCVPFPSKDDELPALLERVSGLFVRRDVTAEDRERTELYRRRLAGLVPSEVEGADLGAFLRGLDMSLVIHDRTHGDRARAVQLVNKTNQFNINGRRVTEEEVAAVLAGGGRLWGATLADRTGAHGEILSCLVAADGTVESFVLSCRVFQRRVEHAFLAWLARTSAPPLRFRVASTARNEPARRFLDHPAFTGDFEGGMLAFDASAFAAAHAGDVALFQLDAPHVA